MNIWSTLVKNVPDTWYYGVETCHVDPSKNLIAVLDSVGYEAFVKKFGKENVKLLWIDLDDDLRRKRNIARLDYDETDFNRRTIKDKESFGNLREKADFIIDNSGNFNNLYEKLLEINKQVA